LSTSVNVSKSTLGKQLNDKKNLKICNFGLISFSLYSSVINVISPKVKIDILNSKVITLL